jgi:phosphatidylglycerol---prolipoprotein diacylglyceryl transferase
VDSVAFNIFGFSIYWYGILTALGFVGGFWTAARRAPGAGLKADDVYALAPWIIVSTVIGARAFYVVTFWKDEFAGEPLWRILNMRSGLVFYGGLVGAAVGTILFCRIQKLPLWRMADVLAPSVPLGHLFGRVGCFMTGCCYGKPTELPWAVHFPKDHATHGAGVHPTQFYEAGLNLALFVILSVLFRKRRFDGQVFSAYLVGYALVRGFVEMFRGDYPAALLAKGATPGQMVGAGVLIAGIGLWFVLGHFRAPSAVRGVSS